MFEILVLSCWLASFLIWQWNRYSFKHPTTRLVPLPLRHTWFAGLSVISYIFLFCLPLISTSFWFVGVLAFMGLIFLRREKSVKLLVDDVNLHRMDKRSLFQHSEGCYMVNGGKTATFMKKRCERLWDKRKNRLLK